MSNLLGVIRAVIGQVYVVEADGSQRLLKEGDRIYSGEEIVTGDSGAVSVSLPDGKTLDLGRNSHWTEQGLHAVNSAEHNTLDIASAQKAIADGADPTHTLEATAAGNEPPVNIEGGGGGHTLVQLDLTGQIISPTAGFPTAGPGSTAPDIIHFDTFNPSVHDARNPENNAQDPIATEKITAADLVVATQTVAFTELTPATNTVPLTQLLPAEPPTPLTQLTPAEPPTPLTQLIPAEPPMPLTQLTPAEPPTPLTQLIPAEPPMPLTQLIPAEPPTPLTQLTPAELPTPLTQLIPAEPPTSLTQLTPAEPPTPLTQLIPAEPPTPLTQLTPAEPATHTIPASVLTPATHTVPASVLTPATHTVPASVLTPATHTAQASLAHVDVNIDLREVPPDTSGSDVIKVNGGSEDPDGFDVKDGKIVAIGPDVRIWLSEGDKEPTCADHDHQIMHYSNGNPGGDSSYSDVFVVHKGSGYTQDGNHRDLDSVHGNTQPQGGADSHKDYIFVQTEVGVTPQASHQTDNRNHNVNTLDGVKVTYTNADGQHGSYFGQSSNQIEGVIFGDGKTHIASDADTTLKHVTPPPAAHDYIIDVTATLTDDNTSDSLSKITLEGLPKGTEIMEGDKVVYTVGDDGKYVIDGSGHGSRWDDHITIRVHGDDKPIITGHGTYEHHDPAPPPAPAADNNSAQHHAADLATAHNAPDVHHKYSASILGNHENNDLNMDTLLHAGKVNQGKSADAAITHSHEADKIDLSALATELEKGSDDVSQLIVTDDHHSNALAVPVAPAPVMASTAGYEHHAALSPSIDHLLHQPEHHSY